MKFRDLGAQYEANKEKIDAAIQEVISECNFISGKQVKELEEDLAQYVGVKHCITCGNGTDALTMMMMAWDIKEGDAVFVPDFTFFASAEIVAFEGATPVFYDVRKDTFNADADSLEDAVKMVIAEGKLKPRAIIVVDLFGQPADYETIQKVADRYNLLVLEDAAQGFGGRIGERRACSFGDAATTSFFPAKPLGCYGDGGAVFTNDDKVAQYLESIRVHGKGEYKYDNIRIGWNSRLDTLQAAILKVKIQIFKDYELENVNKIAKCYTELLKEVAVTPYVPENFYSSWAQYTLQVESREKRDALQGYLKEQNIPTMVYYPKPMSGQTAFAGEKKYVVCNNAKQLCDTVISLPMHPYLVEEEIVSIVNCVEKFLK